MLQLAALTGAWGLSVVTVFAAAAPAVLAEPGAGPQAKRFRTAFAALALVLPALVWGGGALRLAMAPAPGSDPVDGVVLRLVQPNIDQASKWLPELRRGHIETQMRLSSGPAQRPVSHVIWAETAVPFLLDSEPELRAPACRRRAPGRPANHRGAAPGKPRAQTAACGTACTVSTKPA